MKRRPTPEERFRSLVQVADDGCWLWRGSTNDKGYGRFYVHGRHRPAHTWAYEHFVGEIPDGLEPDHLCRVRNCVNPEHLEPVTHRVNSQRAAYSRTTCVQGHVLPEPGPDGGRRVCRECANKRNRAYKARKRAERPPKPKSLPPHGRGRYAHHGCRCDVCCEAERSYKRQWRHERLTGGAA